MNPEDIKKLLQELAAQKLPEDDDGFTPDDVGGGNIDDAYYAGKTAGEVCSARELLKKFFPQP